MMGTRTSLRIPNRVIHSTRCLSPAHSFSVSSTLAGIVAAVIVIGMGAAFFLTDLPEEYGLRAAAATSADQDDHAADDSHAGS